MTSCTISSGSSNNCGPLSYTPMVICFPLMYINIISHLQYQHTCLKFLMFRQLVNNRYKFTTTNSIQEYTISSEETFSCKFPLPTWIVLHGAIQQLTLTA